MDARTAQRGRPAPTWIPLTEAFAAVRAARPDWGYAIMYLSERAIETSVCSGRVRLRGGLPPHAVELVGAQARSIKANLLLGEIEYQRPVRSISSDRFLPGFERVAVRYVEVDLDELVDDLTIYALPPGLHPPSRANIESDTQQHPEASKALPARRRAPSGLDYSNSDAPLIEEMQLLIRKGEATSKWNAALAVADRAEGGGTTESKAKRLLGRVSIVSALNTTERTA